jgi:chemotaxis protein CheD
MIHASSDQKERRKELSVQELLHGKKRFFNNAYNMYVVKIFSGEWGTSNRDDELFATVLGSCVAACVHDPVVKIGGMNHFLLPSNENDGNASSENARYGVYAMEMLINDMLKAGAQKARMEFKVFGGGNVINNSTRIGSKNAAFVRTFLRDEGYKIVSEDLEGEQPRSLHYYPTTGKVMMRKLQRKEDFVVVEEEIKYQKKLHIKPLEGDIELF